MSCNEPPPQNSIAIQSLSRLYLLILKNKNKYTERCVPEACEISAQIS
jgi:hypothetical protein